MPMQTTAASTLPVSPRVSCACPSDRPTRPQSGRGRTTVSVPQNWLPPAGRVSPSGGKPASLWPPASSTIQSARHFGLQRKAENSATAGLGLQNRANSPFSHFRRLDLPLRFVPLDLNLKLKL